MIVINGRHNIMIDPVNHFFRSSELPVQCGEYLLTRFIGHGGYAEVYQAKSEKYKDIEYVAKIMRINDDEEERSLLTIKAEISALISLNHPHVIRIYDYFNYKRFFVMILEYCPNGSIADEISKNKGLPRNTFLTLAHQIVSALSLCHTQRIAHRDIKPSNILLDKYGRAKLADFGLALKANSADHIENTFCGSTMFKSPEILNRKAYNPFLSDIWSLGVTFAVMAGGKTPWKCSDMGTLKLLMGCGKIQIATNVDKDIEDLIRRMVVPDPTQRISLIEILQMPMFAAPPKIPRSALPALHNAEGIKLMGMAQRSPSLVRITKPGPKPGGIQSTASMFRINPTMGLSNLNLPRMNRAPFHKSNSNDFFAKLANDPNDPISD